MKTLIIVFISAFLLVMPLYADEKGEDKGPPGCCLSLDPDVDTTPRARWTRERDGHEIWYSMDKDGNITKEIKPKKFKSKTGQEILEFNFSDRKLHI